MKCSRWIAAALVLAFALPSIISAQEGVAVGKRWEGRFIVNVNGGLQTLSPNLVYEHIDEIFDNQFKGEVSIPGAKGPVFDFSGGVRLFGNFGLGVTYVRSTTDQTGRLTATWPAPEAFNYGIDAPPLVDDVEVRDVRREEDAYHIQAVYVFPITPNLQLGVMGGPSYFDCKQTVLNSYAVALDFNYLTDQWVFETQYPADGFYQTDVGSTWGYNVAVDLNYFFNRNIGVGLLTRYSAATMDYRNPIDVAEIEQGEAEPLYIHESGPIRFTSNDRALETVSLDMGGLQIVGGVRFRF